MGDSARAGTIQLPRAARAASACRRSPRRVRRPLPPRQVWSSGSPRSVGGRAEVQPSRSHHSGRPRAPATGLWPRGFSASDAELGRRPGPCGRLSSASGPDPTDAQIVPPSQEKAAASPVSRTLPAGPRENPVSSVARLSASWARATITLSLQPWAAPSLRAPHRGLK